MYAFKHIGMKPTTTYINNSVIEKMKPKGKIERSTRINILHKHPSNFHFHHLLRVTLFFVIELTPVPSWIVMSPTFDH